jgi:hypothetical protein
MAQRRSEDKQELEEAMKLVNRLSPEDQEQVVREIKVQWLCRELKKAEDSLDRGEGIPTEEGLAELRQRAEERLRKSQQWS